MLPELGKRTGTEAGATVKSPGEAALLPPALLHEISALRFPWRLFQGYWLEVLPPARRVRMQPATTAPMPLPPLRLVILRARSLNAWCALDVTRHLTTALRSRQKL